MKKNILLIGYGNAGRIHKNILEKLGYSCIIVDKNANKLDNNNAKSFQSLEDALKLNMEIFAYDICTDNDSHLNILTRIISMVKEPNIIIEKPVVNKKVDLDKLKEIIREKKCRIFVNENYLFLSSIEKIKETIKNYHFKEYNLFIDFSKDRTTDQKNGRFVDRELLSAGIEGTHMFAILDMLVDLGSLSLIACACDEGEFYAKYFGDSKNVELYSSLKPRKNNSKDGRVRILKLTEKNGLEISVSFGSSNNLFTRIAIFRDNSLLEEFFVEDNSMFNSLDYALSVFNGVREDITFDKSISFVEKLLNIVSLSKRINSLDGGVVV